MPSHLAPLDAWLPWQPLRGPWPESDVPARPGLYRIGRVGESGCAYIGQTGRSLRERIGSLSGVYRPEMPYRDPHTAGPALWALYQETRGDFEASVLPVDGDSRVRRGLEALAIALYRQEHQCSPTVNFGRMPHGYGMSSGDNARLVAAGKRFRGERCTETQESWCPGVSPQGPLSTELHADDWCGHKWSSGVRSPR